MSLTERIKKYFKANPDVWFCGGELQTLAGQAGFEQSNAARRLRELANDGTLIRELRKSQNGTKVAWYRLSPTKYKTIEFHVDNRIIKQATLI